MSAYYDEDDLDYDDNVPEFQDEAEFDDYLNDEEYQLMNDIFPKVVAELADYQGWDNLSVKLAIFDHNFAVDEALIDLKRRYKKKGMYNLVCGGFKSIILRSAFQNQALRVLS